MPKKTFEAAAAAKAHLIVQIKDNQPTLCEKVEAACAVAEPLSTAKTVDAKQRNRHETRTVAVFDAKPAVKGTQWEPHVAALVRIERAVQHFQPLTGLWKPTFETSFYLSGRPVHAKIAARAIRAHWGIENKSHYTRDVTFREDHSRIRHNSGIFVRLQSFVYHLLQRTRSSTFSHERYAAALGGLDALLKLCFS